MKELAPFLCVEKINLHDAWVAVLRNILSQGVEMELMDNRGRQKVIDSCQTIVLTAFAFEQAKRLDTHPQYPYQSTPTYCKELTREHLNRFRVKPNNGKSYLAFERFAAYQSGRGIPIDQLAEMKESLAKQIAGGFVCNNCQAITWDPEIDLGAEASPFVQRIWARIYPGKKIDAHIYWRATDAYNHFESRLICILNMFTREVLEPNGCILTRAACYYDSLFINKGDATSAHNVGHTPTNPRDAYY
jgi:hypothetical protein